MDYAVDDRPQGQDRGTAAQRHQTTAHRQRREAIHRTASFVDRNTIEIEARVDSPLPADGAHGVPRPTERILHKKIIIATGSTSAMPGFLPKHERVVESRAFLDIKELPKSMIVLGGGFIGCELACMAAMLGVKVTIVELLEDILLLLDADVRREVRAHMEKNLGIRVLTGKATGKNFRRFKSVHRQFRRRSVERRFAAVRRGPQTRHRWFEAGKCRVEDQ